MSNIAFGYGIHRQPTLGNDGELSECVNLIPENGELVNIKPPVKVDDANFIDGDKLVGIHEPSSDSTKHYLYINGDNLYYTVGSERNIICSASGFKKVDIIGNTICVVSESGMNYALWKDDAYKVLGDKPEFMRMTFGLALGDSYNSMKLIDVSKLATGTLKDKVSGTKETGGYYKEISWTDSGSDSDGLTANERNENLNAKLDLAITGVIDSVINDAEGDGYFTHPFFVRYAYRTYNGYMMISAPMLMMPTTGDNVPMVVPVTSMDDGKAFSSFRLYCRMNGYKLFYRMDNSEAVISSLNDWSDIITGVDIFVTRQTKRYDTNGKFVSVAKWGYIPEGSWEEDATPGEGEGLKKSAKYYMYNYNTGYTYGTATKISGNQINASKHLAGSEQDGTGMPYSLYYVAIGYRKNESEFYEELNSQGVFYKICHIPTANLGGQRVLNLDDDILSSLEGREQLTDELYSNDKIIPNLSFIYNRRLNIADITRSYHDYDGGCMFNYTNVDATYTKDSEGNYSWVETTAATYMYDLYLNAVENGTKLCIKCTGLTRNSNAPVYLFYPNMHITSGTLVRTDESGNVYAATLAFSRHKYLNGSYWFNSFNEPSFTAFTGTLPTVQGEVTDHNMIYVSGVNDPFTFSTSNMNAVGAGRILGISTASKALSGGTEFGANPLLCFCTDGIWPLSVGSDGTYTTVKPLTRDVCNNPDAILQMDNAVAFTTSRGIMITDGSESGTACISLAMDGKNYDESILKGLISEYDSLIVSDTEQFSTMAATCRMLFDFANRYIHVYPASGAKHYIYSMDAKEWSSAINGNPTAIVPGYPESTMQMGDGMYQYQKLTNSTTLRKGILLTRPTSLGNPYAMKMIEDLKMTYSKYSDKSKCYIQPFVSNDRNLWFKMTSLRSHSFKWYRFAILTNLTDIDGLEGLTLQDEEVRRNKIR